MQELIIDIRRHLNSESQTFNDRGASFPALGGGPNGQV